MPRLTDIQLVLLSNAAKREDGAILPLPRLVTIAPGPLTRVLNGLLKKGLVQEQAASADAVAWREDAESGRRMLIIAPAGLDAIGVVEDTASQKTKTRKAARTQSHKGTSKRQDPSAKKTMVRPGTKLAAIVELLRRNNGATIAEMVDATRWQQHSVRGAISGSLKKKLGLTVASEPVDGRGRVYRIVEEPNDRKGARK